MTQLHATHLKGHSKITLVLISCYISKVIYKTAFTVEFVLNSLAVRHTLCKCKHLFKVSSSVPRFKLVDSDL